MHAYYAKESPIPPPTIVPPSSMLSPMFDPQKFFLPEELLSPKKQGHNQSFSSTTVLPQEFEMGAGEEEGGKLSTASTKEYVNSEATAYEHISVRSIPGMATLCTTFGVRFSRNMMDVFIGGLPRRYWREVTASKPQLLKEAIKHSNRLRGTYANRVPKVPPTTTARGRALHAKGIGIGSSKPERMITKCLSNESLVIPMKELRIDDKLNFVEEPVEIMDLEVKQLKQSRIPMIKVRWNSKRGPEFTWEREDQIRAKYPHLLSNTTLWHPTKSLDEILLREGRL
ncbi:hypothetical protein Tco_1439340 [Tanacetum coccineum]